MKTKISKIIDFLALVTIAVSLVVSFIVVPGGNQGYGYDDHYDFKISHEIYEQEGHLTATQIILSPALSMYLALDKNWFEVGGWFVTVIGIAMIIVFSLVGVSLCQEKENWKVILAFALLVGYILTTLVYLLLNQIVDNGYSW